MTYNENGYTKDEIDDLIYYLENEQGSQNELEFSDRDTDLLIEALEFYKEMNYQ